MLVGEAQGRDGAVKLFCMVLNGGCVTLDSTGLNLKIYKLKKKLGAQVVPV